MKRVYIHCGFHKTATTYLQRLLRDNQAALAPHLHVINRVTLETEEVRLAAMAFAQGDASVTEADLLAGFRGFAEAAAAHPAIPTLISDEEFFGPHPGRDAQHRIYPHAPRIAQLMLEAFAGIETEIVLYRRNNEAWIRSVYAQAVKQNRYAGSYYQLMGAIGQPVRLEDVCDRVAEAVGSEHLTVFELEGDRAHEFGTGGPLFDHIGLDPAVMAALKKQPARNQSLSPWALRVMRVANRLPLSDARLRSVQHGLYGLQARVDRLGRRT